jgi:hypothetical protein
LGRHHGAAFGQEIIDDLQLFGLDPMSSPA